MLSIAAGARRVSPSQNIHLKKSLYPTYSVMYITDSTRRLAHTHDPAKGRQGLSNG
jgi:hypothetical protein